MKGWIFAGILLCAVPCVAKTNNHWLKSVSKKDHARVNPLAGSESAVAAGAVLFHNNCARCHGDNAEGKGSRPNLRSDAVRQMTDGDLYWILKNGDVFHGMPRWSGLPEQERWQIITYIRSLPLAVPEGKR